MKIKVFRRLKIKYDITMVENYLNVFCFVKKEFSFMHKESLSIHNILI